MWGWGAQVLCLAKPLIIQDLLHIKRLPVLTGLGRSGHTFSESQLSREVCSEWAVTAANPDVVTLVKTVVSWCPAAWGSSRPACESSWSDNHSSAARSR